jgi:hypothetical protein
MPPNAALVATGLAHTLAQFALPDCRGYAHLAPYRWVKGLRPKLAGPTAVCYGDLGNRQCKLWLLWDSLF